MSLAILEFLTDAYVGHVEAPVFLILTLDVLTLNGEF